MVTLIQIFLPVIYLVSVQGNYLPFGYNNVFPMREQQGANNGYNLPWDQVFNQNFDNMPLPWWGNGQNNLNAANQPSNQGSIVTNDVKVPVENSENNPAVTKPDIQNEKPDITKDFPASENSKVTGSSEISSSGAQSDDSSPKTNDIQKQSSTDKGPGGKVSLRAKKDYLMVDDTGNAFLLYENTPNRVAQNSNQPAENPALSLTRNADQPSDSQIAVSNNAAVNYQQPANNVVYLPVSNNQQQPVYQVVNGNNAQQPGQVYVSANGQPVSANPPNNNNPQQYGSQVYQLVNGQLVATSVPSSNNVQQPTYQVVNSQPISTSANTNYPQQTGNQVYQMANGQPAVATPNANNLVQIGNQWYQVVSNPQHPSNQAVNEQSAPKNIPVTVQTPSNQVYQVVGGQPTYQVVQPNSANVAVTNNVQQPANPAYQVVNGQTVATYQQQPSNQVYQVVNGQQSPTNIPQNANYIATNPASGNTNPSYILIYANGQWLQIPGVVISTQQQPAQNNVVVTQSVPSANVQTPNNPVYVNAPITNPISNTVQYAVPNNNLQSNGVPNSSNQPPITNIVNSNPTVATNSPITYSVPSNAITNQQPFPTPNKEGSDVLSNQNHLNNGHNYIEAQPAVMFSGFKDKAEEESKKQKDQKEDANDNKKKEDSLIKFKEQDK